MKLLDGKKGLVLGLANGRSIAWGIASACREHGAELCFTYLNASLAKRVVPLAEGLGSDFVLPCDVRSDEEIAEVFTHIKKRWGGLDFIVHSLAFAPGKDLKSRFSETSRNGFGTAMDVSAYSLIALLREGRGVLRAGSSVLTLTYFGGEKVVPNYRLMGVAKAALDASVRELAADLGPDGIRVNAISAGPIKTLAASGISDFKELLTGFKARAPLKRLTTIEDVGKSALYLLSDLSTGVTGEILHTDCGFNITAL